MARTPADKTRERAERARSIFKRTAAPRFEPTEFIAYVHSWSGAKGGGLAITLLVEPTEKYAAMPLTDASGHMLLFRVDHIFKGEPDGKAAGGS